MNCSVTTEGESSFSSFEKLEDDAERNWLELPRDVMSLIFIKVGAIDILLTAQSVCSSWRLLSKEPHLFRCIDMRNRWDLFDGNYDIDKIGKEAVDRSCGQLVDFGLENSSNDTLLQYATDRSSILKCLRLVSCYHISDYIMIEAAKKFPLMEELELCHCAFSKEVIEAVGRSCPKLKFFRLNDRGVRYPHLECDEEALTIAENMPGLRRLHLFGNKLSDNGLKAILDCCPHLESLDLRQCFSVYLEGDLQKRCTDRIRKLRLPDDSTEDYEYDAGLEGYESSDEDYPSGFSDIDSLSDDEYYEFSDTSYLSDYDYDDDRFE